MLNKQDSEKLLSEQIRTALYQLNRAKQKRRSEIVVKIYRNYLAARRPGIKGFFTDFFCGRNIMLGTEDEIANKLIAHLRGQGYSTFKVTNRKTGIVKVIVSLQRSYR